MVVVSREPEESDPMLMGVAVTNNQYPQQQQHQLIDIKRKNSYPEDAYKLITSSMKTDPLDIKSPKLALELLQTAIKLQNPSLAEQCVRNLDENLTKHTALMIYGYLAQLKTHRRNSTEPSAPPIILVDDGDADTANKEPPNQYRCGGARDDAIAPLIANLKFNCLLTIDVEADHVLKQKEIADLSYGEFYAIACRDTLQVSSETIVYDAMYRWGIAECERLTLNTHTIKEVLRQLCYAPRYGLMTRKEFTARTIDGLKGPMRSGILDESDWRLIKFYVEQTGKSRKIADLPHKMSRARTVGRERPIPLSSRSERRGSETTPTATATATTTTMGTAAPVSTVPSRKESGNYKGRAKCEECFLNFLSCWTAVFD